MRVLMTGATGFIGRALCSELTQAGGAITALTRRPDRAARILGSGVTLIGDLDRLAPTEAFDVVVNLAGEPIFGGFWTDARKRVLRDSRVGVTERLVASLARFEHQPKTLISASAIGYYGDRGDMELTESVDGRNGFAHRLCADWEAAAGHAGALGMRVCLIRIGLVIGRDGGFLAPMLWPFRAGLGGTLGDGRQWMSWIHLRDLTAAIRFLADRTEASGVYNAVAPTPVRNREFTETLGKHLNRPTWFTTPACLLNLALGEMGQLLLASQRVLPSRLPAQGFAFQFETLDAALAEAVPQTSK